MRDMRCRRPGFSEMEKRAEEALSGSVKMIGADEFHAGARKLIGKISKR